MWRILAGAIAGTWVAWASTGHVLAADRATDMMRRRLFPELARFLDDPGAGARFAARADMILLRRQRWERLRASVGCAPMPDCALAAIEITPGDAAAVAAALAASHAPPDLRVAWDRDAAAINRTIAVYGLGVSPHYSKIDGMMHDAHSADFIRLVDRIRQAGLREPSSPPVPWDAADVAIALLDTDRRLDAIRFAPLWQTENAPALALARRTTWKDFPYGAILVPGQGPETRDVPLAPMAEIRLEHAVQALNAGQAPFVIVSGGSVHPDHARFVEAYEMRRRLMDAYHIPQARIVLEPYARHTTTNLRNAARAMTALGAPADRPLLIVTDNRQKDYIESRAFADRSVGELGYAVGEIGPAPAAFSLVFHPAPACRQVDPSDPLDP